MNKINAETLEHLENEFAVNSMRSFRALVPVRIGAEMVPVKVSRHGVNQFLAWGRCNNLGYSVPGETPSAAFLNLVGRFLKDHRPSNVIPFPSRTRELVYVAMPHVA